MDLLYIGQTGFKDIDLVFNKILSPSDKLVRNETIVTVNDELLLRRLLATGRYVEVGIGAVEEDADDDIIYEDDDDVIEELDEDYEEED